MRRWGKWIVAAAAPLLLTGCLWGPGKFDSTLTLKRDGSFMLAYKGEIMLQRPDELDGPRRTEPQPWSDEFARCTKGAHLDQPTPPVATVMVPPPPIAVERVDGDTRPCTKAEIAEQKARWEKSEADRVARKKQEAEEMAKVLGLPGLDDESNRAFAAKLTKYAGWRSVTYKGRGVFDVDYLMSGTSRQDFLFPAMPDNDMVMPFVALRRRADGSVQVSAPMFAGQPGMFGRAAMLGMSKGSDRGMPTKAQGKFTIVTDGEILTNNSEDGPSASPGGRSLVWDVTPETKKIPEALIRL
ncbi:hypothetical protein [Sphingomonas arenae]|uniref:hypothetical protein n=1 Tax=Sphingomonas arenae TaxID=2812555 RepID=UPI00196894CC|nr:hypothetical protein [Sphingomonas arenae]